MPFYYLMCILSVIELFFLRLHSTTQTLITHAYSHLYEYTYANAIPISIFEDWTGKSSRLLYLGHFQLFKLKYEVAGLQGKLCLEFISKYSSSFSVKCDEPYVDILGREFLVKRWSISASMPNFETCNVPSILQSGNLHLGDRRDLFSHDSLDACKGTVRPTMGCLRIHQT